MPFYEADEASKQPISAENSFNYLLMSLFAKIIISIFSIFRLFDPNLLKSKKLGDTFKETEIYEKGFSKHYKKIFK